MAKPRIAFFGTPWIAAECLTSLLSLDVEVVAVVCQPDRQRDRKNNLIYCDVKNLAILHNLKLLQPEKVNDIYDTLSDLHLDLIITCAFGQFVSERILNLPTYRCINIHASLLPQLRGGAPIHWAIIRQHKTTGITFMYMAKKMDAGNIIYQAPVTIDKHETYDSLLIKLAKLAQSMLLKYTLPLCKQIMPSIVQDEQLVTFGYNISLHDELLNFHQSVNAVDAQIRGLYSKPIAKLIYLNQTYKIHAAQISDHKSISAPGTINCIDKTGMYISTNDYDIIITQIQAPNKQVINVHEMVNGKHCFCIETCVG